MGVTQDIFEKLVREKFDDWPDGATLDVVKDKLFFEFDRYKCTLRDAKGGIIGIWQVTETLNIKNLKPRFKTERLPND